MAHIQCVSVIALALPSTPWCVRVCALRCCRRVRIASLSVFIDRDQLWQGSLRVGG